MCTNLAHVNIRQIKSFKTILSSLKKLNSTIPKSNISQFLVFNKAYYIVTCAINQATEDGYFNNPVFIEKFTVSFAKHYFTAINNTVSDNHKLPIAWSMVNRANKYKSTPNFVFLMMGANAHINHDLPLALLQLMKNENTDDLLSDVLKLDKILIKSGKEIIRSFNEPSNILNFLKRNFIFLYYRPVMYIILYWRIRAWRSYRSIKNSGLSGSTYVKRSVKIAKRFLILSRYSDYDN